MSSKHKNLSSQRIILKVKCYTPISKPLNGSLPRSNNSHMLRLYPIKYQYGTGKEKKEAETQIYLIKGLRGAVRHAVMWVCKTYGMEVCHTTDKQEDKSGNKLLPAGFHLLAACAKEQSCIVHEIFGSKGKESLIAVFADPITSVNHKTAQFDQQIQNVHIATENRVNKTYDGKTVQDFGERYFSGHFSFEINVTRCSSTQIGLLIEAIMNIEKMGRGYNSGYGHVLVEAFQLLNRTIERKPIFETDSGEFKIQQIIDNQPLKQEVKDAMKGWEKYRELVA